MINENKNTAHKISLEEIISNSFSYWKATLGYQALVTLLYFGIIITAGIQLSYYYFGDQMAQLTPESLNNIETFLLQVNQMMSSENGSYFQLIMSLIKASMFPLQIGLFKIYTLLDEQKRPQISDLFDGYNGSNFFKFWGYALFWNVVFQIGLNLFLIPGILWVMATLFVGPLLYFTPMRMVEAIRLSAKVVFANLSIVLPCAIAAFIISYAGLMFFAIGFLFTFPIWSAIIYTLFKKFFNIKFI